MAEDNNAVKYLLVRENLFDRTVDAKRKKTKDSKEAVETFSKMITKKIDQKIWWIREKILLKNSKKLQR